MLATAPAVSRVSPTYPDADYWRFTPAGMAELFATFWEGDFTVHAFGNLRTCIGFLLGEVVEERADAVFDPSDPRFPLTVAVEARKLSGQPGEVRHLAAGEGAVPQADAGHRAG